jgi:hypothetical protein
MDNNVLIEYPYYQTLVEKSKVFEDEMDESLQFYFNAKSSFLTKKNKNTHSEFKADFLRYCFAYYLFPTPEIIEGFRKKEVKNTILDFFIHADELIKNIEKLAQTKGIVIPNKNLLFTLITEHIKDKITYFALVQLGLFRFTERKKKGSQKIKLDLKASFDNFERRLIANPQGNSQPIERFGRLLNSFANKDVEGIGAIMQEIIPTNPEDKSKDEEFLHTIFSPFLLLSKDAGQTNDEAKEFNKYLTQTLEGKNSYLFDNLPIGFDRNFISARQFHIALYPFFMSFCKDDGRFITEEEFNEEIARKKKSINSFDEYKEQKILALLGKTKG